MSQISITNFDASILRAKDTKGKNANTQDEIEVVINQNCYLPGYPKIAIIYSEKPLSNAKFILLDKTNSKTAMGNLKKYGQYPSWRKGYYYFANFSEINRPGIYRLIVEDGNKHSEARVTISSTKNDDTIYDAAKYFYYQRCGTEVPGWHKACHLSDPNGTAGGWHDAGDYNKYIYTQWQPVWALLDVYKETGRHEYLDEASWGVEFLSKMVRPDGNMWSSVFGGFGWTRPETEIKRNLTEAQWGDSTWAVGVSSAVFAKYAAFAKGPAKIKYLELAKKTSSYFKQNYDFHNIKRGEDFQGLGGIALSDLMIYNQTKDERYKKSAIASIKNILAHQDSDKGFFFSDSNKKEPFWDDYMAYFFIEAMYAYAKYFPDDDLTKQIKASVLLLMDRHIKPLGYNTPYRQEQWLDILDKNPRNGDKTENFYPNYIQGWIRGSNSYYLSTANTAMIAYKLLGRSEYKDIAINQLNWIFGINPAGVSFMEGHCDKCVNHYHHRYDTLPGNKNGSVPGGIVNGIASNNAEDYFFDFKGNTWASNETWLPHNSWLIMLGLKLKESISQDDTAPILPVQAEVKVKSTIASVPQTVIIRPTVNAPQIQNTRIIRSSQILQEKTLIGADVTFELSNIPKGTIKLQAFIYTNSVYPQETLNVENGKNAYTFRASIYKYNNYSGFFIRGFDVDGKMTFQTESIPVKKPQ